MIHTVTRKSRVIFFTVSIKHAAVTHCRSIEKHSFFL